MSRKHSIAMIGSGNDGEALVRDSEKAPLLESLIFAWSKLVIFKEFVRSIAFKVLKRT